MADDNISRMSDEAREAHVRALKEELKGNAKRRPQDVDSMIEQIRLYGGEVPAEHRKASSTKASTAEKR